MVAQTALSVYFQSSQGQLWLLQHFFLFFFFSLPDLIFFSPSVKPFPKGAIHFPSNVLSAWVQVFSGTFLCVTFVKTELIKDRYKERKMDESS